ncbi:ORF MSV196 ALI motif gene family protein [Melanoplus sanguinipes entomopoxvirus]|uniref:ORF MSV196 ALI motif gene family protein n=1 Tax=Melanoplus sanguinipes entomopoxvirus TaxID=83191 RepID=Q9YVP6_MSEPV|nr:ORF MSV196 ALI motif gene family protein [Melanoplus sanguinipes entomopoxvirus]AAC97763.1 ORF MSV196 ALI motif gene family protein [Melanoplus sanguinipes entomopoxvirus 'O']
MNIYVAIFNNKSYFRAKDCASILEFKHTKDAIRHYVSNGNKIKFKNINIRSKKYIHPHTVFINNFGLIELILKHKSIVHHNIIDKLICKFDLNVDLNITPKEQKYIDVIISCFINHRYKTQYKVFEFYIDLYFTDLKIAIECDKYNYNGHYTSYDKYRQILIQNELNCKFIRFNPYDTDFNIYNLINKIHVFILKNKTNEFR